MRKSIVLFIIIVIVCAFLSIYITDSKYKKSQEENQIENDFTKYDEIFNSELTGDNWPNNSFTKMMPKPHRGELKIKGLARSRMSFEVSNVSLADYNDYIVLAKEKGLVYNASRRNGYNATNEDGYVIQVYFDSNQKLMK